MGRRKSRFLNRIFGGTAAAGVGVALADTIDLIADINTVPDAWPIRALYVTSILFAAVWKHAPDANENGRPDFFERK